eukprot:437788-Pleurochrysis_carterae.AAC.1
MDGAHRAPVQARDALSSRGETFDVTQRAAHKGRVNRSEHAKKYSVRVQRTNSCVQRNCTQER